MQQAGDLSYRISLKVNAFVHWRTTKEPSTYVPFFLSVIALQLDPLLAGIAFSFGIFFLL
jgi:hypothetical protein